MKYLVYSSVATRVMSPADLESILRVSRDRNATADITGLLIYRDGAFIQFLEGPSSAVDALMDEIAGDNRHERIRVLLVEPLEKRSFEAWRMGFGMPTKADPVGAEAARDSYEDLTSGEGYGVVRRAAEDFSIWFRVRERAGRV